MGAECSKLRQPMRAILALSRAQLLLIVVTRSRDLSRECHVTKHKTPAKSNFPMSNFENSGTIQFSSSRSTSRGLFPKHFEKRAHPNLGAGKHLDPFVSKINEALSVTYKLIFILSKNIVPSQSYRCLKMDVYSEIAHFCDKLASPVTSKVWCKATIWVLASTLDPSVSKINEALSVTYKLLFILSKNIVPSRSYRYIRDRALL